MPSLKKSASGSHKPHIVFLYYYFPPMGGGGVQRIVKWLKYWDYQQFRVTVLTVKESYFYASDESLLNEIPASQVRILRSGSLDVFRGLRLVQRTRGTDATVPSALPTESHDRLRKLASWFAIPDSRVGWLLPALTRLWHLHREDPIDLLIASMPPFTAGLIGGLFQHWQGVPYIVDYRDAWLMNPYIPRRPAPVQRVHYWLEKRVLQAASGAVFVNPELARLVLKAHPEVNIPWTVVRNGYDPSDFEDLPGPAAWPPLTIGIMGSVYSQGNRPFALITAIRELLEENPQYRERVRVQFIGKWSPGFLKWIERFPFPEIIQWHPYLPHRQALALAARCHVLALTIEDKWPGSQAVTPGRLYEYLALGRPILAIVPQHSDVAAVVTATGRGVILKPANREQLKAQLVQWMNQPPVIHNGREKELREFTRHYQTRQLVQFLQQFL